MGLRSLPLLHSILSRYLCLCNQRVSLDRDPDHDRPGAPTLVRDPTRALGLAKSLPLPKAPVISIPQRARVIEGHRRLLLEGLRIEGVEVERTFILILGLPGEVDMEEDKWLGLGRLGFQLEVYRAGQLGIGWVPGFR